MQHDPVLCFSHLRWDFVFQRPQHLMSRFGHERDVWFIEEPCFDASTQDELRVRQTSTAGVRVVTPYLKERRSADEQDAVVADLLRQFLARERIQHPVLWYYTPMMITWSRDIPASSIVYDCMDELTAFLGAPSALQEREVELLERATVVFTGGRSLFDAKRPKHRNVHLFPSSVDTAHFARARQAGFEPVDQQGIPSPRVGFCGVIDERFDTTLLGAVAAARPEWSFVMIGPVVKIDPAHLPSNSNIHYLGQKDYSTLPAYLSGWDAALLPFAMNESTRFISPTKTPEYLAAGLPVVSTPIQDVVRSYGDLDAVFIGGPAADFERGCAAALELKRNGGEWQTDVDERLSNQSWDRTFAAMKALLPATAGVPVRRPLDRRARGAKFDAVIVGAGFAGAVLAERLARGAGRKVLVIDKRPHIAGNAFDRRDAADVLIHQYGPHIFHTNCERIYRYLSQFTRWRPYQHRVLASIGRDLLPIPINRTTLNKFYGLRLESDQEAQEFLQRAAEPVKVVRTAEDAVVSSVGRELYEAFFRDYTRKQWGRDPSELDKAVTARVPARYNTDDRYFTDRFQCMPLDGYTAMFENMLDHPGITVELGTDFESIRRQVNYGRLFYSGPIDEFFGYRFGKLPYRSLRFEHKTIAQRQVQPVAVVNYPGADVPYTRITEYKHLTGQVHPYTSITYEYPSEVGDPYYPIPASECQLLYRRYAAAAAAHSDVTFVGRLGTYRYYNMDQVVGQSLATYARLVGTAEHADEESGALPAVAIA